LNVDRLRRLKRDPRFLDPDESAQRCDVALGRGTDAIAATLGRLDPSV
jgi:hypothetical protein